MDDFVIIPANPGFCFLLPLKTDEEKFNGKFSRIPIVAWKISKNLIPEPISMDGDLYSNYWISAPGDKYITDADRWFDSLFELTTHLYSQVKE